MKLSTRSTYGMRALVELALASGRGPLSATLIAKRQGLSVAYLEQLLHRLKRWKLVSSVRGPKGGYVLAKAPRQITMAEVVGVLEGNGLRSREEARRRLRRAGSPFSGHPPSSKKGANGGSRYPHPIAEAVRRCVHERLAESLGAITLEDVSDQARTESDEPLEHRYVFHI